MKIVDECLNNIRELEEEKFDILNGKSLQDKSSDEKLEYIKNIEESINLLNNKIDTVLFEGNSEEVYEKLTEINIRKLDMKTKRSLRKLIIAIQLAKKANDPLYTKYKKGVMIRKNSKRMILLKYGAKAYQIAMSEKNGL